MPVLRYQVRLPRVGGLPEDDVINVFHFDTDQTIEEDADDIAGRLFTWYSSLGSANWSSVLTGTIAIKAYEIPDPPVGSPSQDYQVGPPVYEETRAAVLAPSGTALPSEVAVAVTLIAEGDTSVPLRNRRGRVFLGPLAAAVSSLSPAGGPDVRPSATFIADIGSTMETLATGPDPGDGRLCVYSPTWHQGRGPTSGGRPGGPGPLPAIPGHTLDQATQDVTLIQVDNAFDTQRRRGARATTRSQVPVVP